LSGLSVDQAGAVREGPPTASVTLKTSAVGSGSEPRPCFVDIVWVKVGKFDRPGVECALSIEVSEISGWETLSS